MTVILRPPGRGNWQPVVLTIAQSKNSPLPLYVERGQILHIGGQALRVVAVLA